MLDVRSPSEFNEGHIHGAHNLFLFDDEERKQVGVCYKHNGRDAAVALGLDLVGPQLPDLAERAKEVAEDKPVYVYCWRGGMRSGSVGWLLETVGLNVHVLQGGYKAYRKHMYDCFDQEANYRVIGGMTGSAKTEILQELERLGEQVIDLEGIARHKGSAFGNLTGEPQPTSEHFQNLLFNRLQQLDESKPIWIEDESQHIGSVWVNDQFLKRFKSADLIVVERTLEDRVNHLCEVYGNADVELLKATFEKIGKRLGGQHVKEALSQLDQGNLASAAQIALKYYDKSYQHMLDNRMAASIMHFDGKGKTPAQIAKELVYG